MNKKIVIAIIVVAIIATSGYLFLRNRDKLAEPKQQQEQQNIDENINGYKLEDDIKLTQRIEADVENRANCIGQDRKMQYFSNLPPKKINTILERYNSTLPQTINNTIQYPYYNLAYDYFLITADTATLREKPSPESTVVATIQNLEKVTLLQKAEGNIQGDSKIWYRIVLENNSDIKEGYIHSSEGAPRKFEFTKMQTAIDNLKRLLAKGELHYISNYKNYNGAAPRKEGARLDEFGYRAYHSAPAYEQADINSNYRYVPDGILVRLLGEAGEFYQIYVPTFGANYYVPKRYIDPNNTLKQLKHVVVVDRSQQNEAAFEVTDNGLNLISYTLATTGIEGEYSFVTTLGMFKAIEKKDRFQYLRKGTSEIAGYAPYAIRFTGGAYIHGVPVAYKVENGQQVDPGTIEYLHTIGTFARSSMCVRNFTSHAEFLHSWMDLENGAVIVIE